MSNQRSKIIAFAKSRTSLIAGTSFLLIAIALYGITKYILHYTGSYSILDWLNIIIIGLTIIHSVLMLVGLALSSKRPEVSVALKRMYWINVGLFWVILIVGLF